MDFKPEDLYPIHEVPVMPPRHIMGKYVLASIVGIIATAAANKAYDFGLGAYRQYGPK